jgi:hypothetical protein
MTEAPKPQLFSIDIGADRAVIIGTQQSYARIVIALENFGGGKSKRV